MIHQPMSLDGVHPQISSSLGLLVLCLVRHILPFVYFSKELISFIGSIDKCHTSVFNALIFQLTAAYQSLTDKVYTTVNRASIYYSGQMSFKSAGELGGLMITLKESTTTLLPLWGMQFQIRLLKTCNLIFDLHSRICCST